MRFGVTMFPTDRALSPIRLGSLVEDMGFESRFLPEHSHVPVDRSSQYPSGGELPEDFYRLHDPLESLAAVAAVTSRIRLGTSTLVIPDHDPIMLAKRVSTLDHLSGGRVVLGVGAGWNLAELANHGSDPRFRWTIFRERVEAMKVIWTNEVASYEGKCVRINTMKQWPKPVPETPPAGAGRRERTDHGQARAPVRRRMDSERSSPRRLGSEIADRRAADDGRRTGQGSGSGDAPTGHPHREAIEEYMQMGLVRVTFRVDPGDEGNVTAQLERLVRLVDPYRLESN